jgi:hypothetical protein
MRLIAVSAACLTLAACGQQHPATTASTTTTTATAQSTHRGTHLGDCLEATVSVVGSRLQGMPNSGSAILYTNGMSQVSYDAVPGIDHSQAGDAVHLCLVSVPQNCPPGDDRGKVYSGANQRTGENWQAPDSEHACGAA